MTPPTVNAYYSSIDNKIGEDAFVFFSAIMLVLYHITPYQAMGLYVARLQHQFYEGFNQKQPSNFFKTGKIKTKQKSNSKNKNKNKKLFFTKNCNNMHN